MCLLRLLCTPLECSLALCLHRLTSLLLGLGDQRGPPQGTNCSCPSLPPSIRTLPSSPAVLVGSPSSSLSQSIQLQKGRRRVDVGVSGSRSSLLFPLAKSQGLDVEWVRKREMTRKRIKISSNQGNLQNFKGRAGETAQLVTT